MAEASINPPTTSKRFFCHECNARINQDMQDYTCPSCGSGFIEELDDEPQFDAFPTPMSNYGNSGNLGQIDFSSLFGFLRPPPQSDSRRNNEGGSSNVPGINFSRGLNGGLSVTIDGSRLLNPEGGGSGGGNPVENMLQTFLSDLISGLNGQAGPGIPMVGNLNLGDYAWGRDGLDAIVTSLMNQMDGSGPPPLPTHRIDTLPSVAIVQEQVDKKLQCSVCWDYFGLGEEVKQLPCEHVYHPPCILPWLKLHGTCPICRRDFTDGADGEEGDNNESSDGGPAPNSTTSNPSHTDSAPPPPPSNISMDFEFD